MNLASGSGTSLQVLAVVTRVDMAARWPPAAAMAARGRQGRQNGRQVAAKAANEAAKAAKAARGACGRQVAAKAVSKAARWPPRSPARPPYCDRGKKTGLTGLD